MVARRKPDCLIVVTCLRTLLIVLKIPSSSESNASGQESVGRLTLKVLAYRDSRLLDRHSLRLIAIVMMWLRDRWIPESRLGCCANSSSIDKTSDYLRRRIVRKEAQRMAR